MTPIEIRRSGTLCAISGLPGVAREKLKAALTFTRYKTEVVNGRMRPQAVPTRMWSDQVDGGLVFMAGYLPRVHRLVTSCGLAVSAVRRVDGRPDFIDFDPAGIDFRALRPEQIQMLEAVVGHAGGVITTPTGSGKSYCMRELCALYPRARIVLCAPGVETVRTLQRYLDDRFPGEVGQVGAGKKNTKRITISTYNSVLKVADLEQVDILVADEAHKTPAETYGEAFAAVQAPLKRFAFTATPDGRGDRAEWMMEGLFGPTVLDVSYGVCVQSGSVVPLKVLAVEQPYGPEQAQLSRMYRQVDKDRTALWRNARRNQAVADDVRAVMAKYSDPQTLVLVDRTEHALALKEVLPEFEVVYGDLDGAAIAKLAKRGLAITPDTAVSAKDRDALRKRFETGEARRVIATGILSTGVSSNDCQIVAVAGGSGATISFLQSIGRGSRKNDDAGKTHATCLLWKDTFARSYLSRSQKLIRAARKAGHAVFELSPLELSTWAP